MGNEEYKKGGGKKGGAKKGGAKKGGAKKGGRNMITKKNSGKQYNKKTRRNDNYKMKQGKPINRKKVKTVNISSNLNWKHENPKKYIDTFSNEYFRKPDIINKNEHGVCIWYPKSNENIILYGEKYPNVFTEHWCRDESIVHMCPSQHTDFFYSFIDIDLSNKLWNDVLAISGSIGYDPLKKKLYARCGSVEANIASLYTCILVNKGKITLKELQTKKIYAKNIQSTKNKSDVIKMYKYLLKTLSKKVPKTGYWEIAFPSYKKEKIC